MGSLEKVPQILLVTRNVIVNSDLDILLMERAGDDPKHRGMLEVPGGKVDKGETLAEGFDRELREECGRRFRVEQICDLYDVRSRIIRDGKYKGLTYVSVARLMRHVGGSLQLDRSEHASSLWVPPTQVRSMKGVVPESRAAVKHFAPIVSQLFEVHDVTSASE